MNDFHKSSKDWWPSRDDLSLSISVGCERKFFELERAERKNFRAEPSASDITRNDFRAEPSSSGKSFERLRARAKPSEHKSFFEHDFSFNFEQSKFSRKTRILRVLRVKPSAKTLERHYYTVTAAAAMPKRFRARRGRGRRGRGRSSNHHMRERSSIGQQ